MPSTATLSKCPPSIGLTRNGRSEYAKSGSASFCFYGATATRNHCSVAGLVDPADSQDLGPLLEHPTWGPSAAAEALEKLSPPRRAYSDSTFDHSAESRKIAFQQGTTHAEAYTQFTLTGSPLQLSPVSSEFSPTLSQSRQSAEFPSQPSRTPTSPKSPDHSTSPTNQIYSRSFHSTQPTSNAESAYASAATLRPPRQDTSVDGAAGTDSAASILAETAASKESQPWTATDTARVSYWSFPPFLSDEERSEVGMQLGTMASSIISVR